MLKLARQPPTIVTRAELDFYDFPLIRPNGFVNSGRQRSSSQELLELLGDGRRYDSHRMLSRFHHTESACYTAQEREILRL